MAPRRCPSTAWLRAGVALCAVAGHAAAAAQQDPCKPDGAAVKRARTLVETTAIAKCLASKALQTSEAAIEVLAAEEVVWPDSALGCAAPGQSALQVLTPGYLIRLRAAGGAVLDMHADRRGHVRHCPGGTNPRAGSGTVER